MSAKTDERWTPPPSWEPIAPRPRRQVLASSQRQIPPCYLQGPQRAACASFLPSLPMVLPTPPGSPLSIFSSVALWPRCGPGRSWAWCPGHGISTIPSAGQCQALVRLVRNRFPLPVAQRSMGESQWGGGGSERRGRARPARCGGAHHRGPHLPWRSATQTLMPLHRRLKHLLGVQGRRRKMEPGEGAERFFLA